MREDDENVASWTLDFENDEMAEMEEKEPADRYAHAKDDASSKRKRFLRPDFDQLTISNTYRVLTNDAFCSIY